MSFERRPLPYLQLGAGPPLVLIGGLHGHYELQRPLAAALAEHFEVWCPSLPGETDPSTAPASIQDTAAQILDWAEETGLKDFRLCGISLGGAIALAMAIQKPARVRRLASVVSFAEYLFPHPGMKWLFDTMVGLGWERACRRISRVTLLGLTVHEVWVERAPREALDDYLQRYKLYRSRGELIWRRLKMMRAASLMPSLPQLRMPAMMVAAGRDRLVHPQHMRQAAGQMDQARLQVVETSGHLFPFLRPTELAALLRPFFLEEADPHPLAAQDR